MVLWLEACKPLCQQHLSWGSFLRSTQKPLIQNPWGWEQKKTFKTSFLDSYSCTYRLTAWNWCSNQNRLIYWTTETTTDLRCKQSRSALHLSNNLSPNISNILDFFLKKEMQWTKGQEFLGYLFQSPRDLLFDIPKVLDRPVNWMSYNHMHMEIHSSRDVPSHSAVSIRWRLIAHV